MTRTSARHPSRRRLGVVAVAALALAGLVAPGVAEAAGELPGGTVAAPVAAPLDPLHGGAFGATNVGVSTPGRAEADLIDIAWYSFTPAVSGDLVATATSTAAYNYDLSLEVWTAAGSLVGFNDDWTAYTNARVTGRLVAGTTYLIGLGGYYWDTQAPGQGWFSTGTAVIDVAFTPSAPTVPLNLQVSADDEAAVVAWDPPADPSGVTRYVLTCTADGGAPYACGETVAPSPGAAPPTTLTLTGLTNGVPYTVSVQAENPIGLSPAAGPVAVTPQMTTVTTVSVAPGALVSGQAFVVFASVVDASGGAPVTIGSLAVTVDGVPVPDADPGPGFVSAPLTHLAGPMIVSAVYTGTAATLGSGGSVDVTVGRQTQTLTVDPLPGDLVFGDMVLPHATSSHGLPVTFTATGACTVVVNGSGVQELWMTGVGLCELTGHQAGTSEVTEAEHTVSATVARAPQAITVSPLTDMVYGTTQPVTASSDAELPVALAASGACTLADGVLSTSGVGVCTVTATQAGDTSYLPAPPVVVTVDVTKRADTVTISDLPTLITGVANLPVTATSAVGLPVTITGSGACMVVDGGLVTMDVGLCTVTATTAGDEVTEPASAVVYVQVSALPATVDAQLAGSVGHEVAGVPVSAAGLGLRPGTPLSLTVHSTPTRVGAVTTSRTGVATVSGVLPALADGTHRLVAIGTALDGTTVTDEVVFGVDDGRISWVGVAPSLANTGPGLDGAGTLAALWLVAGLGLLVLRRTVLRRRRVIAG